MQVLYYASDKADDEGEAGLGGGITLLIEDVSDRLDVLCDRLELIILKMPRIEV